MANNMREARVSLSELVSRAIAHEDLPAEFDSHLRWGAWLGMGLVSVYLILLWALHAQVDNPWVKPGFPLFWWEAIRGASFLGGAIEVPVVLGLGTLFGGGWLAIQTGGFAHGTRWQQLGSLGLVVAGGVALMPLLVILTVAALNLVVAAVAAAIGVVVFLIVLRGVFEMMIGG